MSVQSRVPTQQYQNRFARTNNFQSSKPPQFAVQELFNVETDTVDQTLQHESYESCMEDQCDETPFPIETQLTDSDNNNQKDFQNLSPTQTFT